MFANKKRYLIGIDPGTKTGIALYDLTTKKLAELKSLPIHKAMEYVKTYHAGHSVKVRMEDARKRKWIPKEANEKAERGRREGAGYVKAHCSIWEAFLTDLGIDVELVAPKNNKTKVKADLFVKMTGYTGQTNEHSRDAAGLVIGF